MKSSEVASRIGCRCRSGNLISERRFAEGGQGIWKTMKDGTDDLWGDILAGTDVSLGDIKGYTPQFIHLASAEIWTGTKELDPSRDFPSLWRGRLNRVDGFVIIDQTRLDEIKAKIGWVG